MRHASAVRQSSGSAPRSSSWPATSGFSLYPLPRRAAAQLRLALDAIADAPVDVPEPIPLHAQLQRVRVVLQPRLAWPDRPERARMPDGSPADRRADFYDWIAIRRRRAQMAARRAMED